ncbi:MAG: hypothetical protein KY396_08475, partial [Actinobacteria bacterium]|nr:hypothetical protein [Actinomycetota bacterium]
MSEDRVVVTGIGLRTPLGHDCAGVWERLLARETASRSWRDLAEDGFPCDRACRIGGRVAEPRGRALAVGAAADAFSH